MTARDQNELDVFRDFTKVVDLLISPETICHGQRREPDIVCDIRKEGKVGFELTELIDEQLMAQTDLSGKIKNYRAFGEKGSLTHKARNSRRSTRMRISVFSFLITVLTEKHLQNHICPVDFEAT